MSQNQSPEHFISLLYRKAADVALEKYPVWALDLLQQVISFDGAVWGTGHVSTQQFHTHATVDVSTEIFTALKETLDINPIFAIFANRQGEAIDMADVYNDKSFYRSELYQQCFKPFGIERILSSIHVDERSGIFTLLTLYRYDRDNAFSVEEKETQTRLLYHLLSATSYRQFLALKEAPNTSNIDVVSAICDEEGAYHAVEARFLDLIEPIFSDEKKQHFPSELLDHKSEFSVKHLHFTLEKLGELYRVSVRSKNRIDDLTLREKQVVQGICDGNTFKQLAKNLSLSPSTVSNHLYRIYDKLGINSRSELVTIALSQDVTAD